MNTGSTKRLHWLIWIGCVVIWFAVWLYPESNGRTRLAGLALVPIIWSNLIVLLWAWKPARYVLLFLTVGIAAFLAAPISRPVDLAALRAADVAGLKRYEGVKYYWGGESPKGIDCSGLMRRGMIDGMFLYGIRSGNPALVRSAVRLWWHDCTAADLGSGKGDTNQIEKVRSINVMDLSKLQPGDMATTTPGGAHIVGFIGGNQWIEADPGIGKVVVVQIPTGNGWFKVPMQIVRWQFLAGG